jgi:L-lactate dehydrogenase complex protein LldF
VKIDIPEILIHLRSKLVESGYPPLAERAAMKAASMAFADGDRLSAAQTLARLCQWPFEHDGQLRDLPGMLGAWTSFRDLAAIPKQSFRDWWAARTGGKDA